jgi:hypothetical protein
MPLDEKYLTKYLWTKELSVKQNVCRQMDVGQIVHRLKNVDSMF